MTKRIEDFGTKIGGAKKDVWKVRGLKVEDLDDIDLREYLQFVTKDNIWPTPNYEEYLEWGMHPVCIYFMKNVRDKIQAKIDVYGDGRDRQRAELYIKFLHDVKHCCEKLRTPSDIVAFHEMLLYGYGYLDEHGKWTEKARKTPGLDNIFIRYIQFKPGDVLELKYETEIQRFPQSFRGDLKGVTIKQSFFDGRYKVVKGNKVISDRYGFKTAEEALEWAKTTLIKQLDEEKEEAKRKSKTVKIVRPQLQHIVRNGPDLRKGNDVTTDHILQAFKFRGGEFGNWNTQEDRQAYLNYAFDALIDLAYVLQCPLEFISFYPHGSYNNQMLAIAFGARGSGTALAHYECGRVVINLTKIRGAGCLAHEWAHALDDFLGVQSGIKGISTFLSGSVHDVRLTKTEIVEAFRSVMDVIKYKTRSVEEVVEACKEELNKLTNVRLKSWIDSELKYFAVNTSEKRRAATEEEKQLMNSLIDKLYETGEKQYLDEIIQLYKDVKGILPSKEMREIIKGILSRINVVKNTLKEYEQTGTITNLGRKETNFYRSAQELDKHRREAYYSTSCEMFARCFESYIEDRLPFKSQYLVHSTHNISYGELKPYPEGEERQAINEAIDNLMRVVIQAFGGGKAFPFNNYYKNSPEMNKSEEIKDKEIAKEDLNKAIQSEVKEKENVREAAQSSVTKKGISIESAIIMIYVEVNKKLDNTEVIKQLNKIQGILNSFGQHYYNGHKMKYNTVEDSANSITTSIAYEGLVIFSKPVDHLQLKNTVINEIKSTIEANAYEVKIIEPRLQKEENLYAVELERYNAALSKVAYLLNNVKAIPKNIEIDTEEAKESFDLNKEIERITDAADLREVLVKYADELIPGQLRVDYVTIFRHFCQLSSTKLQLGYIEEGHTPVKYLQGNSKGWVASKGKVIINSKETIEKKLESAIEPIVKVLIIRKYGNSRESDMISSGVTYMICKKLGLDVRSYCLTEEYERIAKNKGQLKHYFNLCGNNYKGIIASLELDKVIR